VVLGITLSRCVCMCMCVHRVGLGGKGNVLYPVLSSFHCYLFVLIRLKQFYASSSNLQYFKNLIKVPSLPDVCVIFTENFCYQFACLMLFLLILLLQVVNMDVNI